MIGIDLLAPTKVTVDAINGILEEYELPLLEESDLEPFLAAQPVS